MLNELTWARVESVMEPKAGGAWALHEATVERALDFFVLFSSIVSVLGAPAQSSYAAANACLDALAHHRRSRGLPAISINWGPWGEIGMAARLGPHEHRRWAQQGISFITPERGVEMLRRVLSSAAAQVVALPIDWELAARQWSAGREPRLLARVLKRQGGSIAAPRGVPSLLEALDRVTPSERAAVVRQRVEDEARGILGLSEADALDSRQPLRELGLDSLMALELRNALGAATDRTLPATLLFRYPTVEALTTFLRVEVLQIDEQTARAPQSTGADAASLVADLEDDDVKRLLAEELASLSAADWNEGRG